MTDLLTVLAVLLSVGGATYSISAHHLMRGILGLTAFFLGIAAFFGKLGAWYLVAGQLFLFVGGVVTLFVLAFSFTKTPAHVGERLGSVVIAALVFATLFLLVPRTIVLQEPVGITTLASYFFSNYGWVLNIALLLLFSAVIGAQYIMGENA